MLCGRVVFAYRCAFDSLRVKQSVAVYRIRFCKLQAFYIVPGITLTGLGLFFLCFSLDIISVSFAEFARMWWPLIFVVFGLVLIVLFLYMQKQKTPVLAEDSEDDEEYLQ